MVSPTKPIATQQQRQQKSKKKTVPGDNRNLDKMEKKARLQKLQDDLLQKMPPGVTGKQNRTIATPNQKHAAFKVVLAEHKKTTFYLMVQTAAQGLPTVPVTPMTDARKATLRKLKFSLHGQRFKKDERIRLIEQAEAAAVQMYIENKESMRGEHVASI